MKILNCDICGTLFPDTEEKCPTCGYSRAFVEEMPEASDAPAVRERVRGGRYSKKNVLRRLKLQEEQAAAETVKNQNGAAAVEALVAEMESPVKEPREEPVSTASDPVQEPVPVQTEEPAEVQREEHEEQAVPVWNDLIREKEESAETEEPVEAEEPVAEAEPAEEEQAEEMPAVPAEVSAEAEPEAPEEPVIDEADQASEYGEEQAFPEEEVQTAKEQEAEKKKAVLKAYRRDVRLNLLLFISIVVFLLSLGYVTMNYDLSDIQDMIQPAATTGDAPTDEPAARADGENDVVLVSAGDGSEEAYIVCYDA